MDTIVSLKGLVLDIQQHFTLFLLFFSTKIDEKKLNFVTKIMG